MANASAGPDDFDPDDRDSWYFGTLTREQTNDILQAQKDNGVFLVRDSSTLRGDLVLCVKEDNKISHYIINKLNVAGMTRFRIGDQEFSDLPNLLTFYKTHYLDTTPLLRPAPREQFIAKYEFGGKDPEDLPFKKGEILTILLKDEEQWWTARNSQGRKGSVPVPYLERYDASKPREAPRFPSQVSVTQGENSIAYPPIPNGRVQRTLPARAKVIRQRIPNAYDDKALRLEIGDIVLVTAMNVSGQWEGEVNNKKGDFPFNYVEFIDDDNPDDS